MARPRRVVDPNATTKECCRCHEIQPLTEFHRAADRPDGRYPQCRACKAERARVYREGPYREGIRQRERERAQRDADKRKAQQKLSYARLDPEAKEARRADGRERAMKRTFGITMAEYEVLWAQHGGVCGICHRAESEVEPRTARLRRLAIDHDHDSGRIRGLLCRKCNTALGLIGDDRAVAASLLAYLERHDGG